MLYPGNKEKGAVLEITETRVKRTTGTVLFLHCRFILVLLFFFQFHTVGEAAITEPPVLLVGEPALRYISFCTPVL